MAGTKNSKNVVALGIVAVLAVGTALVAMPKPNTGSSLSPNTTIALEPSVPGGRAEMPTGRPTTVPPQPTATTPVAPPAAPQGSNSASPSAVAEVLPASVVARLGSGWSRMGELLDERADHPVVRTHRAEVAALVRDLEAAQQTGASPAEWRTLLERQRAMNGMLRQVDPTDEGMTKVLDLTDRMLDSAFQKLDAP